MTRSFLYVGAVLLLVTVAVQAYRVHYDTLAVLDRVETLQDRIAEERQAIAVLEAEWAWLNRPDRLARMVERHRGTLGLVPLTPGRFGDVDDVAFQPPPPHPPGRVASGVARPVGAILAVVASRDDGKASVASGVDRAGPASPTSSDPPATATPDAATRDPADPTTTADARHGRLDAAAPPVPPAAPRAPTPPSAEAAPTIRELAGRDRLALGLPLPPPRPILR